MAEWWSIEVLHGEFSAFRWQEQHDSALIEAALTNGAVDGAWHADRWGIVFEICFDNEEWWETFRNLPAVRAALDAVPDPVNGLLIYRGRGGGAGDRKPRQPRPAPSASAVSLPEPDPVPHLDLTGISPPDPVHAGRAEGTGPLIRRQWHGAPDRDIPGGRGRTAPRLHLTEALIPATPSRTAAEAETIRPDILASPRLRLVGMTVWVEFWQMQCCGEPFRLGDRVAWTVRATDTDWLEVMLGTHAQPGVDAVEDHHGGVPEGTAPTRGTVTRIAAVHCRYAPRPGSDSRTSYPVPGSGVLTYLESANGRTADRGDERFAGYLVELKSDSGR